MLSLADASVFSCSLCSFLLVVRYVAVVFPLGVAGSCLKCAVTTVSTVSTNDTKIPTSVWLEPSPCVVHVNRQCGFFISIMDVTRNKSAHVGTSL